LREIVLRRISEIEMDEVRGSRRKLHNETFCQIKEDKMGDACRARDREKN
jgi:hypothetical protein